jgi:isopentenyldiphosphate isomerase
VPDPNEAEDYRWASLAELLPDMTAEPAQYSAWFHEYVAAEWPLASPDSRRQAPS